jgi:hypothetical protein
MFSIQMKEAQVTVVASTLDEAKEKVGVAMGITKKAMKEFKEELELISFSEIIEEGELLDPKE